MNINLLPEELKNKNKSNLNIIKVNFIMFIFIVVVCILTLILKVEENAMKKEIFNIDKEISSPKYIFSENILKDIQTYNKSIELFEKLNINNLTITKGDLVKIIDKVSQYAKLTQLEYNSNYSIIITGIVDSEKDLIKIIDGFLKSEYTDINILERSLTELELIQFTLEIKVG